MTISLLTGDCRSVLPTLPERSVQTVVTSPPYFGLRDYETSGQIGLEATPTEFVETMVAVFREVRRVLRDDGTLWLNLGDSYANDGKWGGETGGKQSYLDEASRTRVGRQKRRTGVAAKSLIGIPWRVAFALQEDGWFLRQEIVWHKLNPMPESVLDRPTRSHEQVFLFAKSGDTLLWRHRDGRWTHQRPEPDYRWRHRSSREETAEPRDGDDWIRVNLWRGFDYYYDADAIAEPSSPNSHARAARKRSGDHKYADGGPGNQTIARNPPSAGRLVGIGHNARPSKAVPNDAPHRKSADPASRIKANDSFQAAVTELVPVRNKRSVWPVASEAFRGDHFAAFPPALIEPCILAGCPMGGTVLDPFGGVGTTGLVADRLQRNAILIEVNARYAAMARDRLHADAPLLVEAS